MQHAPKQHVAASLSGKAVTTSAPIKAPTEETFTTGVARRRDRLDSATSTSALKGSEIEKAGGEGNANYSIRGLPLAATGSKFMQLQEDGMPVLEFGDMLDVPCDMFMRFDLNVAQVEAIRGGSASTFASNSPGGVINLLSKTGDVEGGAVQTTLGLNYGEHRIDADYGHKLSDTLRFHIGGFYRQGEGPRTVGYDAYKGGQLKFNVTKTFANGSVRVYGKYLDDRTPSYLTSYDEAGDDYDSASRDLESLLTGPALRLALLTSCAATLDWPRESAHEIRGSMDAAFDSSPTSRIRCRN